MKILGFDYGEKRIGVAVGEAPGPAVPLMTLTIASADDAVRQVVRLAHDEHAGLVVVGLPLLMSGERGPQAARVSDFVERLRRELDITVETVDERLTSKLADRVRDVYGKNVSRDALAAAAILETYFDRSPSPSSSPSRGEE